MTGDGVRVRSCSIAGCDGDHYARGWCRLHYMRWHRHGDPLTNLFRPHVTQHGTANEYSNYGCRCDACRAAAVEYQRALNKTTCSSCGAPIWRRGRRGSNPTTGLCRSCVAQTRRTAVHGTESRYAGGCRCDECRRASRDARRRRRARVAA